MRKQVSELQDLKKKQDEVFSPQGGEGEHLLESFSLEAAFTEENNTMHLAARFQCMESAILLAYGAVWHGGSLVLARVLASTSAALRT